MIAEVKSETSTDSEGFFVYDHNNHIPFLIDSGASRSILPLFLIKSLKLNQSVSENHLRSVTGDPLEIIGNTCLTLQFNQLQTISQNFIVAKVPITYGILGFDFIKKGFSFSSNPPILRDQVTQLCTHLICSRKDKPAVAQIREGSTTHQRESDRDTSDSNVGNSIPPFSVSCEGPSRVGAEKRCRELLNLFPELTSTPNYSKPCSHQFVLDIDLTDETPLIQQPRRCSALERQIIAENFRQLQEKGAVIRSSSYYASPITVVKKRNGGSRVCADYSRLNSRTRTLNYPLPLISSLTNLITEKHHYFSVLDLRDAYHNLPMTPRASQRAGITTLDGLFLPKVCPFGLKNAPSAFSEMIASVIEGLTGFVFAFIDDFLIFSETLEEHLDHLRRLLCRFKQYGFYISPEKCVFARDRVHFLGHEVSTQGIRPLQKK